MNEVYIDCSQFCSKEGLHEALAQALCFPDWYGHNLDALYDCLTDLDDPVHLHLQCWDSLPTWRAGFAAVLDDAESEFSMITVSYE